MREPYWMAGRAGRECIIERMESGRLWTWSQLTARLNVPLAPLPAWGCASPEAFRLGCMMVALALAEPRQPGHLIHAFCEAVVYRLPDAAFYLQDAEILAWVIAHGALSRIGVQRRGERYEPSNQ